MNFGTFCDDLLSLLATKPDLSFILSLAKGFFGPGSTFSFVDDADDVLDDEEDDDEDLSLIGSGFWVSIVGATARPSK